MIQPEPETSNIPRTADEISARLDAALAEVAEAKKLVRDLYRIIRKQGGYSTADTQATVRRAATYLVEWGDLS